MATLSPPLAKITCPAAGGTLPRKRLFRLIDQRRKRAPFLWISGPPGAGKTTLAGTYVEARKLPALWYRVDEGDDDLAGFFYYLGLAGRRAAPRARKPLPLLTPEYLGGIPGFGRLFFESLFARLPQGGALVFDDYHEIPAKSPLHEVVVAGLSQAPEGTTVLFLSRRGPPPAFSRFRVNNRLAIIEWEDLRLTLAESRGIARLRGKSRRSGEALRRLHTAADGWAAGLVLMLERGNVPGTGAQPVAERAPGVVFEYFGSELFDRAEKSVREFLVKTALLPDLTAQAAEALTGERRAQELLSFLARNSFFLTEHFHAESQYRYHPLFREFLISRAQDILKEEEIRVLKGRAAALLEQAGRIEDAARLLCDTGDHDSLARLTLAHAPSLLGQGRNRVLEAWLGHLPEKIIENDPWLLFWLGKSRMPYDPVGSRAQVERSFELFWKGEDRTGTFVSWSLVMDNLCMYLYDFNAMDRWIDRFEEITERFPSFPSPEIEARAVASLLGGLYMRRVDHPEIEAWVNRASAMIRECGDIAVRVQAALYLFMYYVWIGDFPRARGIVDSARRWIGSSSAHPQRRILLHLFSARLHCGLAQFEDSVRAVAKGLEVADASGMHAWDFLLFCEGTAACLGKGDLDSASAYLRKMAPYIDTNQPFHQSYFHHLSGWHAALRGDISLAAFHEETALALIAECGAPCGIALSQLCLARLGNEMGKTGQAADHLEEAVRIARGMKSPILEYQCVLVEADIAFLRGDEDSGRSALRKALSIGREKGYFHYEAWLPSFMTRLCVKALEEGMEILYVQELIRRRNLIPDSPPVDVEAWPWLVRIHTLGHFSIQRDGEPLPFSRKVQKRPLSLLKALIAFGGRAVREEQLADALWPEAEGDMAIQSMAVALSRLRQLLGREEAVQRREGILALDPRYCWVDAFAFERLLGKAASKREAGREEEAAVPEEKALALYRGPFLAEEAERYWAVPMRERLRSRYLSAVGRSGARYLQKGQSENAREWYLKGIDVDNLAEEFYQSLIQSYLADRREAEALAVFERLKKTFSSLGVEPSPRTRNLLGSLRST